MCPAEHGKHGAPCGWWIAKVVFSRRLVNSLDFERRGGHPMDNDSPS